MILLAVAVVRELLGFGTLLKGTAWEVAVLGPGSLVEGGLQTIGLSEPMAAAGLEWRNWTIMVMPPGAFFVLAIAVWTARAHSLRRQRAAEAEEASK
jgi:Na+-transporting NADH:ubiquinone oxidoreductase subunit NqrD